MLPARVLAAALALATIGLTGCTGGSDDPAPEATPTSTPLGEVDTTAVSVVRGEFCPRVPPAAVTEALGGEAARSRTWANGDKVRLSPGVRDVVHEYGCSWSLAGTEVRAWVFAPPVAAAQATALRQEAAAGEGCAADTAAPRFGQPSVAVRCTTGRQATTTFHGLFGDAWLSCSLRTPVAQGSAEDQLDRAGRWCAAVLAATAG